MQQFHGGSCRNGGGIDLAEHQCGDDSHHRPQLLPFCLEESVDHLPKDRVRRFESLGNTRFDALEVGRETSADVEQRARVDFWVGTVHFRGQSYENYFVIAHYSAEYFVYGEFRGRFRAFGRQKDITACGIMAIAEVPPIMNSHSRGVNGATLNICPPKVTIATCPTAISSATLRNVGQSRLRLKRRMPPSNERALNIFQN